MEPTVGGYYKVCGKTVQVQFECQVKGYFGCCVLEDGGEAPFKWNRGQIITLQYNEVEHMNDFKNAVELKLVPVKECKSGQGVQVMSGSKGWYVMSKGWYVMQWSDKGWMSESWHPTLEEAQRRLQHLLVTGTWFGMKPKIEESK